MYYKYKNLSIYYEKYGNKKDTLIILPGWGNNRETFKYIINLLKEKYTIYIFDYPGFGKSSNPKEDLTIYTYAEIFINFIKENNIKNPSIIGHSFGGRIIITMAGFYKIRFKKIILMSSAGIKKKKTLKQKIKHKIYKLLKKLVKILPKSKQEKYQNKLITIFGSNDYKQLDKNLRNTFINIVNEDLTKYLNNIIDETLIMWGDKDNITPISDAYIMNNLIKNSGLIAIKNTTHFFYIEKIYYVNLILSNLLLN